MSLQNPGMYEKIRNSASKTSGQCCFTRFTRPPRTCLWLPRQAPAHRASAKPHRDRRSPRAHSMTVVVFTVPPGVRAGQQIVVQAPNGQRVTVQLPANTRPGQRMQVNVPEAQAPSTSAPPAMLPPAGAAAPPPSQAPAPSSAGQSLYEFVVPQGAKAFQRLMVQVPSGQRVNVQLPAGAAPGMRMRVAVPTGPGANPNLPPVDAVARQLGARSGQFHANLNVLRELISRTKQRPPPQPANLVLNVRRDRILEDALWHFLKETMSDPAQVCSAEDSHSLSLRRPFPSLRCLWCGFAAPSQAVSYQVRRRGGNRPRRGHPVRHAAARIPPHPHTGRLIRLWPSSR